MLKYDNAGILYDEDGHIVEDIATWWREYFTNGELTGQDLMILDSACDIARPDAVKMNDDATVNIRFEDGSILYNMKLAGGRH
jgi:hypothetical protein